MANKRVNIDLVRKCGIFDIPLQEDANRWFEETLLITYSTYIIRVLMF